MRQHDEQDGPPINEAPHPADAIAETPRRVAVAKIDEPVALIQRAEAGSVALTAQVEARIKAQFILAKQFPRNWTDVHNKLLKAFERPVLAEGAIYSKPIGSGSVSGLSIRFAEEAFRTMGNIIVESFLVSDDDDKRVYTVTGMDMETNASIPVTVVVTKQIERSSKKPDSIVLDERTNAKGKKVFILKATSEDDYRSKEQAQLQKARRDVILFLTPADIKEECEEKINETIADRDRKDPDGAARRVSQLFFNVGVSTAEIEKFLGHPLKMSNAAETHLLRTIYTGIKEGEGTWAEVIESKLGANTGADAEAKGAGARLRDVAKKAAPAKVCEECGTEGGAHNPDCKFYHD